MQPLHYVVLHHTGFGDPHFDLMFETAPGELLTTFRAPDWPPVAGDELTRIGDHRRDYLEYEGPLSNDRGQVRRAASGTCEVSASPLQVWIQFREPQTMLMILQLLKDDR